MRKYPDATLADLAQTLHMHIWLTCCALIQVWLDWADAQPCEGADLTIHVSVQFCPAGA